MNDLANLCELLVGENITLRIIAGIACQDTVLWRIWFFAFYSVYLKPFPSPTISKPFTIVLHRISRKMAILTTTLLLFKALFIPLIELFTVI